MDRKFIRIILLGCLFYSGVSISGSPGGLFLFVTQMELGFNEKDSIDNYFKKHYGVDSALSPDCETIYRNKSEHARPMVDVFI